jgi:PAS domain S-box-containing protein
VKKKDEGLRDRAEKWLRGKTREAGLPPGQEDALRMVHELQVHQIELELQNEELKEAREALEMQLEKYSGLYNFAPIGYFTLDGKGTIREANLTGAQLLAIERSRLVNRRLDSFLANYSLRTFDGFLRKVLEGTDAQTCEVVLQGDPLRHLQIEGIATESDKGGVRQCRMAVVDITTRKQAEEMLRASEERHRFYMEVTGELSWTTNSHGEVAEDLPIWRRFTGQHLGEIMGAGWIKALHPDDVARTMEVWDKAVATKSAYEIEYRIRRYDGVYRHFLVRGVPVIGQEGHALEWVGTCIDITERKAAEETLRRYELLSGNSRDIVLFMRREDGKILEANVAAVKAYGYSRDELVELAISDLRAVDTLGLINDQMARADEGGVLFETIHRRKDGSTFPAEVSAQGTVIGGTRMLLSVVRDIGERKMMEESLREHRDSLELKIRERTADLEKAMENLRAETTARLEAERELRQVQKIEAIGLLAGGIAHDFNNILAAIMGFSEMAIEDTPEGSSPRRHMETVLTAGMRGRDLVKQILTFSRQAEEEKGPLQLSTLIRETSKLLRAVLPSTIQMNMNLQGGLGLVLADPIQLQQVIMNLFTNAAHAMRRKGGTISLDLARFSFSTPEEAPRPGMDPGDYIRISVSDTGEGMSPAVQERIFDPFFTTKPPGEGTGLGLSVVHGIIASHGGMITVASEPEKGSTFTIYIPQHRMDKYEESTALDGLTPRGQERVLFIDDEEDIAAMGDQMLTSIGYRVVSKTRSREALALFRLNPSDFDVVITDQTMPEITGLELAKEIIAIRSDIPIILCTGFSRDVDAEAAKATGIRTFLSKPLTRREIAQTIREVLGKGGAKAQPVFPAPVVFLIYLIDSNGLPPGSGPPLLA